MMKFHWLFLEASIDIHSSCNICTICRQDRYVSVVYATKRLWPRTGTTEYVVAGLYWCRTKIVHWTFSSTIYDEMRFKRHLLYVKDKQKLLQFIVTVSCYITLTCYANIQIRRKYHRLKSDPEQPWTLIYRPWFWSTDFNDTGFEFRFI